MTHVRGMAIEAMWGRAEVWVLASPPGRVFTSTQTWGRKPLVGVVVRRWAWHISRIFSLGVVKAVRSVGGSVIVVPGRKLILHEAWRETAEVVRWWRLVEGRWLLVRWKWSSEVRRSLHAWRKGRLPLAPRGLLRLRGPWCLLVI